MFWDFLFMLGIFGSIFGLLGIADILGTACLFLVYHFLDDGELGFFDYMRRMV